MYCMHLNKTCTACECMYCTQYCNVVLLGCSFICTMFTLNIALDELRGILRNVENSGTPTSSASVWQDRMERRKEAWEVHRPAIYEQMMSYSYMPSDAVSTYCLQLIPRVIVGDSVFVNKVHIVNVSQYNQAE